MKKISRDRIREFVRELEEDHGIIAPVMVCGRVFFKELGPDDEVDLKSNPTNSPREFFLPHSETLFEFKKAGDEFRLKPTLESGSRILFGIRPCDVHALSILDLVGGCGIVDPYYQKRREKTILIALSCPDVMEGCSCTSFGTGPSLDGGVDLLLTDIGDYYLAKPFTDYGRKMIKSRLFEDISDGDEKIKDDRIRRVAGGIEKQDLSEIPDKIAGLFDSEMWGELSRGCVSCAICTYLCPTCYCFDVVDEDNVQASEGKRIRCWDTCMFPSFTMLAGGENPRTTKKERLRQRIYHKLKYFRDRHGRFGCVGCGRCIRYCPGGVNIMEIISRIK